MTGRDSCGACCFFFNDTATTEIYTLSLHDALPISHEHGRAHGDPARVGAQAAGAGAERVDLQPRSVRSRSEEHTSELQSPCNLVCRLLLEKKKNNEGRRRYYWSMSVLVHSCLTINT